MSNTISIKIETLTPLHIGSGRFLGYNFDYLKFGGELAITDSHKVLAIIGADNIDQWVNAINNGDDLLKLLKQRKQNVQAIDIAQRIIKVLGNLPEKKEVKEQLHLGAPQKPILPGSSLKGSIRTAIFNELVTENSDYAQNPQNIGFKRGDRMIYRDSNLIQHYLAPNYKDERRPDPRTDLFRLLHVGDAFFDAQTIVIQNNIINQYGKSWGIKTNETSYWECIPKGSIAYANLQVPKELIRQMGEHNKLHKAANKFEWHTLFNIINNHTLDLIEMELDFWKDEDTPLAIGNYESLLSKILDIGDKLPKNECIIRVGAGNGWDFMTGGWVTSPDIISDKTWSALKQTLRSKFYTDNIPFPKTRKLLEKGEPLGFLKLSIVS